MLFLNTFKYIPKERRFIKNLNDLSYSLKKNNSQKYQGRLKQLGKAGHPSVLNTIQKAVAF